MERLLSVDEVVLMLGVSKATIYSWTHKNKIPHIKLSRRLLKFRESDILAWIERRSNNPSEEKKGTSALRRKDSLSIQRHKDSNRDAQIDRIVDKAIREVV
jgi:excisionase family DNA binding protein